jgi:hypothetical protein
MQKTGQVECKQVVKSVQLPMLLFREAENMQRLIQHCNDTYRDGRGVLMLI